MMANVDLLAEIERLKAEFIGASENKLRAFALIEQAAYERLYLRRLNEQALATGLVKIHPKNPQMQKALPVSNEISKHSASLTNIMDKLIKHLYTETDDDDDGLDEYA
ncbi:MAG: zinc-binding protein [Clostridia bacterium]|nr:zinc-binding protein [Clostridia bacterium]